MIDRSTWIILADRLAVIRWWHEDIDVDSAELVFDKHDQARIAGLDDPVNVGDTPDVPP